MSEPVEIDRIEIVRQLEPDGEMSISVHYSDSLALHDAMGLLAWALRFAPDDYDAISEAEDE